MNTKTYEYLYRFLHKRKYIYDSALEELKRGKKESHWMWYIFPQLRGLGESNISFIYGIISIKEAKEYLSNPILRARLDECCKKLTIFAPADSYAEAFAHHLGIPFKELCE